jgi:hypothetical protein
MKTPAAKTAPRLIPSARSAAILAALRDARKSAIKAARMHGVPVVYLRAGILGRERV